MTEIEAKTKFCPMTKPSEQTTCCSGSKCMAWRWSSQASDRHEDIVRGIQREGFCGLAGRP